MYARGVMASEIEMTKQDGLFISKSKFLSGLQCHKLLWHVFNAKDLIPEPDAATQAVFEQGHEVGRADRWRLHHATHEANSCATVSGERVCGGPRRSIQHPYRHRDGLKILSVRQKFPAVILLPTETSLAVLICELTAGSGWTPASPQAALRLPWQATLAQRQKVRRGLEHYCGSNTERTI